jgi:capsid protein
MSAILDANGNPVYSQRKFASAADRNDPGVPPMPVFDGDFSELIPNLDRRVIVSCARAIFQDYGPITGALIQKADNVVGRAWAPKFRGSDKEWGKLAKDWLENQWFGTCDVRGRAWDFKTLLWLDSVAIDRDGDFFIHLTESENGYPQTQRISVNRVGMRGYSFRGKVEEGPYKGRKISHGVIMNDAGRPLAYRVLGDKPDEDEDIPAERMIPVFDPTWHDQVRGIPSYSGSIKLVYGSMTATEREQMNQNIRSSIALIEHNDTGGPDIDDPGIEFGQEATATQAPKPTVEHYAKGMIKYFRSNSGGKLESVDNNQPGDMWDRFQDRVIRMASSGINWPYELVWKAKDVNGVLVRNLQERARLSVEDRQDVLKSPALFQIRYALAKAVKVGILPRPRNRDDWWRWDFQMPRKFSIDPGKEAQQRREDYKIGFRNRTGVAEEEGGDAEALEDERIEEVLRYEVKIDKAIETHGRPIDRRLFYMLGPNEQPSAGESEDPPEEEEPEDDES